MFVCMFFGAKAPPPPQGDRASSFKRFLDHTQRRTRVTRDHSLTGVGEWSARRRDLYLTTHNTHNRQTSSPPVGFELTISAGERPQTYALDRAATGTGQQIQVLNILNIVYNLLFFSSKCSLFHNSNAFGSCIIPFLYTGCANIKKKAKKNSGRYDHQRLQVFHIQCRYFFF